MRRLRAGESHRRRVVVAAFLSRLVAAAEGHEGAAVVSVLADPSISS